MLTWNLNFINYCKVRGMPLHRHTSICCRCISMIEKNSNTVTSSQKYIHFNVAIQLYKWLTAVRVTGGQTPALAQRSPSVQRAGWSSSVMLVMLGSTTSGGSAVTPWFCQNTASSSSSAQRIHFSVCET